MPDAPKVGRMNVLRASSRHTSGMYLDGGELGEILLPQRYVPATLATGGEIEVFLMNDSEDRLVATTDVPIAMAGEFAALSVIETTKIGAFLDWGMPKDLLLPFGEQAQRVMKGDDVVVYVNFDSVSGRLYASSKLNKFVASTAPPSAKEAAKVSLLVAERTDIGYKAIVNSHYWGLLHASSVAAVPFAIGEKRDGYISRITEDGLVDVTFEVPGYGKATGAAQRLTEALEKAEGGFLPIHDKSSPDEVRDLLGMSKKVFKLAVSSLYRSRKIRLEADGIHLIGGGES
ncbi:MAG: putative RNA-binding protein (virulence factor B family) [Verrucomicrobiales bacterium]|jgi:predicted RNA-binding protein (virulence factor B family)